MRRHYVFEWISMFSVLFLGACLPVSAQKLEDFGYNHMQINGTEARGQRPLLVILVDYDGHAPLAHDTHYYDQLVFNFAVRSVNGSFSTNSNGRFLWVRANAGILHVKLSKAQGSETNDNIASANVLTAAIKAGSDFAAFDTNKDGLITSDELGIVFFDTRSDVNGGVRWANHTGINSPETIKLPGAPVKLQLMVAGLGQRAGLKEIAHEMTHLLGALDLYGGNNQLSLQCSLMAGGSNPFDDPRSWLLDPWHRMELGWIEPDIYSMTTSGSATLQVAGGLSAKHTCAILYIPRYGGTEYFMVEYRNGSVPGTHYDENVADTGLVIWHVKQMGTHDPLVLTTVYGQPDWRWCNKCQALFYAGKADKAGRCPTGGQHDAAFPVVSGNYLAAYMAPGQSNWLRCNKCLGLFFDATGSGKSGVCPAGGTHTSVGSGNYFVVQNTTVAPGQQGWRWCNKCQELYYAGGKFPAPSGACPAGGQHDPTASGMYTLLYSDQTDAVFTEGAPSFYRGGWQFWKDQTTPPLRWMNNDNSKVEITAGPVTAGSTTMTFSWKVLP